MSKHFSLQSQIAEVERELGQRREVYPRLVASRALRESQAEMQMELMKSVLDTLKWLQANEASIKEKLKS